MKLFNEPADVDYCDRWSTAEESTFLVKLGHVATAPSTEEEGQGQWPGILKKKCCYSIGDTLLITRSATEQGHKTDKHRHQSVACLLIIASKHKLVISCHYGR